MVAPLMPTTIPKGARHSPSPCAAAKRPRSCQARRVPHDIPRKTHWARNEQIRRASNDAAVVLDASAFPQYTRWPDGFPYMLDGGSRARRWRSVFAQATPRAISRRPPWMAKAVCRVLALDCEVVGTVADGSAVLEAAQRLQPDVIVLDLNLPNVNGLEVCRQITQVNPQDESHRVHGDERSGRQATILRGRSIRLCV